ncbi:FimB/Mfa2 family fimbrial subunit [Bacteroides sp. ET71]|uniref:FimB/Mfa2 family fimbrial subunit n=1 Tax=Bacteroides sp. ET71 TaxID=2939421 RepID=UPI002011869C|nr:FimB/Mfa2 family fimbrial subunit [Bacteroides sp. ET71]MCL1615829.1 FimB/Mfa2 family fimbrial subunit [Bacteroides sp. ET71]
MKHLSILLSLAALLSACDAIYDYEGDCDVHYRVRFSFEHNLSYADAFAHEVDDISLFVFDHEGRYVTRVDSRAAQLDDQTVALPALAAGRYTLVAWGGTQGPLQTYETPTLVPGSSTLADLTCRIDDRTRDDEGQAHVGEMDKLFHGIQAYDLDADEGTHTLPMPLVKDTKHVRIVLQHLSGDEVDPDDFIFTLTDDNGHLAHDNTPLPDEVLAYDAWHVTQGTASLPDDEADADAQSRATTSISVAVAELTTSRLMAGQDDNPTTLTISRKEPDEDGTRHTVLSIPLADYALLVKGHYNRQLSDQEYLDRQDEYNLTFFLDEDNNWASSSIIINSWRVVLSDVEL